MGCCCSSSPAAVAPSPAGRLERKSSRADVRPAPPRSPQSSPRSGNRALSKKQQRLLKRKGSQRALKGTYKEVVLTKEELRDLDRDPTLYCDPCWARERMEKCWQHYDLLRMDVLQKNDLYRMAGEVIARFRVVQANFIINRRPKLGLPKKAKALKSMVDKEVAVKFPGNSPEAQQRKCVSFIRGNLDADRDSYISRADFYKNWVRSLEKVLHIDQGTGGGGCVMM